MTETEWKDASYLLAIVSAIVYSGNVAHPSSVIGYPLDSAVKIGRRIIEESFKPAEPAPAPAEREL
jgi:hypothetical protein